MNPRRIARTCAEVLTVASGAPRLLRRVRSDTVAILAYHNIVAREDAGRGDASLHLPLPEFSRQLDVLTRLFEIVDLESLGTPYHGTRPRVVITFDDAYRGAITLGLPELQRRGLPAVVFAAPGLLGRRSTWWDDVAEIGRLSTETRNAALHELGGIDASVRERLLQGAPPGQPLPASYGVATADELIAACGDAIRIGSHTWCHEFLPALSEVDARESLKRALEWLDTCPCPTTRWLALPYGGASDVATRAALDVGHSGVLLIEGGIWRPDPTARTTVPRINVPAGMSARGVLLRAGGVWH